MSTPKDTTKKRKPLTPEQTVRQRARQAAWRIRHREETRARSAVYRSLHREDIQQYNAVRRLSQGEAERAYHAVYNATHQDQRRAGNQAYRAAHGEEIRAADRARYAANPEKKRAASRKRRETFPEETRIAKAAWAKAHPEKKYAASQRRRAAKRNAPLNDFTAAQWIALQAACDHRCVYCGKRAKGHLTQDHLTPLAEGGSHTLSNILPACRSCNCRKQAGPVLVPVQPVLLLSA